MTRRWYTQRTSPIMPPMALSTISSRDPDPAKCVIPEDNPAADTVRPAVITTYR